jgi:hypothetical protein
MESIEKLWGAPRFDWYEGTFTGLRIDADTVVADALAHWDMSSVMQVRPRNGVYMRACEIVRGSMCILHMCWGGYNEGVHFIASGAVSHEVWEWLGAKYHGMYSVSRADVRQDCTTEGMWDYIYKEAERFALNRRIKCRHVGDYLTGKEGRTLYMGGTSAATQCRIYEKGKKEGGDLNWIRLEFQVRPAKSKDKALAASYLPFYFIQQSGWAIDFYSAIMKGVTAETFVHVESLSNVWKVADADRSEFAMLKQYGRTLERILEKCGGDAHELGSYIVAMMQTVKEQNAAMTGFGQNPYSPESPIGQETDLEREFMEMFPVKQSA